MTAIAIPVPDRHRLDRRPGPLDRRLRRQAHGRLDLPRPLRGLRRDPDRQCRRQLRLEGRVAADSIVVKDENLATHLKAPDFFDTESHPYVTFTSTLIRAENGDLIVDGELTIKGHTRPIEARGTLTEPAVTFGDVEKVGLELEAIVDRTEYGLTWNAPLPKGGFALANEVKLHRRPRAGEGVDGEGPRPLRQPARRLPQLDAPAGGRGPAAAGVPSSSSSTG